MDLEHLVADWRRTAEAVSARTGEWYWEEWMNDLDTRQGLEELLDSVPEARSALPEIAEADAIFNRAAVEVDQCQWWEETRHREGWTPTKNWWYWREPPDGYL